MVCTLCTELSKWDIAAVLRSTNSLFNETTARREDYTKITGTDLFGQNFCNTRWLENVPVAERLLEMFPHLCKYVAAAKKGDIPLPHTKAFGVVSEATCDPLFPVKLNCFVSVATTISPFLLRYQTDRPILTFLASDLHRMVKHLLYRFMKRDVVGDTSLASLAELNLSDSALMRKSSDVDIGFTVDAHLKQMQRSAKSKVSDRDAMGLRHECRAFSREIVTRILMKAPTKFSTVRNLSCLDPRQMAADPNGCCAKLRKVLQTLVNSGKLVAEKCDDILRQYTDLVTYAILPKKDELSAFDPFDNGHRVDVFLERYLNGFEFADLWSTVKMLLLLSHGQASIERGFSVNQQMEVDNLCENTFIAQRVVHDHIGGGIFSVDITKDLMLSCQASRPRYQSYLDDKKRAREPGSLKRKRVDESDDLNAKKLHLEADIAELDRCADEFSTDAEKKRDFSLVAKSNALRRSAKEKREELADVVHQLNDLK